MLEIERGRTRSQTAEDSLWKRLRTCRKTDCLMMMMMMMMMMMIKMMVVVVVVVMCLFRRLSLHLHMHVYFIRFWWRLNYDSCSWAMAARVARLKDWNLEDPHSLHLHVELAALWLQMIFIEEFHKSFDGNCSFRILSVCICSTCCHAKTGSTYWIFSVIVKEIKAEMFNFFINMEALRNVGNVPFSVLTRENWNHIFLVIRWDAKILLLGTHFIS